MTRKEIAKLFKRFLITFACLLPIFIGIGLLLNGKIQNWIMVFIFVTVGGLTLALEEYIHRKNMLDRQQKKEQMENKK